MMIFFLIAHIKENQINSCEKVKYHNDVYKIVNENCQQ